MNTPKLLTLALALLIAPALASAEPQEAPKYPPTDGEISFTPAKPRVGEPVTFTVKPKGGTGGYQYDWSGSVGSMSVTETYEAWRAHTPKVTYVYKTPGKKFVTVVVYSVGTPKVAVQTFEILP